MNQKNIYVIIPVQINQNLSIFYVSFYFLINTSEKKNVRYDEFTNLFYLNTSVSCPQYSSSSYLSHWVCRLK